jgi:hypothetical protein
VVYVDLVRHVFLVLKEGVETFEEKIDERWADLFEF